MAEDVKVVEVAVTGEPAEEKYYAVSITEIEQFGCPYCGYRSAYCSMSGDGAGIFTCGDCGKGFTGLAEGIEVSPIGFGATGQETIYPKLEDHPRRGIPKHGKPDKQPESGGEFFRSRGIGLDITPGCFVCGGERGMRDNIAAFVQCKDAGERVVAMFSAGARLDYREQTPDRVQVKVGSCKGHLPNLERLSELTVQANGEIRQEMIQQVVG